MAKLIILALAFAALVAFATAHTTIVTTTIEDENPIFHKEKPCRQHLQGKEFNQCRMYLQLPFQHQQDMEQQQQQPEEFLQQCCQEFQNVDEECKCKAVKQLFRETQQHIQHQQAQAQGQGQQFPPIFGPDYQTKQLTQIAMALPRLCHFQSKQCSLGKITTTVTQASNPLDIPIFRPQQPFGSSWKCSQSDIQRPVNQCQRYVEQQLSSPRTLLMSIDRPDHQQQELQQCCDQLQNVKKECQCPAIIEVGQRVMQPHQQGGFFGGDKKEIARRVLQNLPNECNLEVQQCSIPFP